MRSDFQKIFIVKKLDSSSYFSSIAIFRPLLYIGLSPKVLYLSICWGLRYQTFPPSLRIPILYPCYWYFLCSGCLPGSPEIYFWCPFNFKISYNMSRPNLLQIWYSFNNDFCTCSTPCLFVSDLVSERNPQPRSFYSFFHDS